MEYEDNTGAPELVEEAPTTPEYTQEELSTPEPNESVEESPQERNWREMRESLKELKKQNEELSTKLSQREQQEAYQQWQLQQQQASYQSQYPASQPEETYEDDDLLTAAQAKKLAADLAKQEVEKYFKQQEAQNVPQRLQQQYNDYADIVNQENVQKLIQEDPETAEDIESLKSDPMRMSRMLYKTLKARYGEQKKEEDPFVMAKKKEAQERQERAPSSSSAVPKRSALAEANAFAQGLTPELKQQLLSEMDEAAKRY